MNIAVLDLETNGMAGSSVLSASSLVFNTEGAILDLFNHFYEPHEPINHYAVRVHGLTPQRLASLRSAIRAPRYFLEEWPDLLDFWGSYRVAGIAVHNLTYDTSFLPEIIQGTFRWWCSMRGLTARCAILRRPGNLKKSGYEYKWPRLQEAADILCNGPKALEPPDETARIEALMAEAYAHVSLYDCFELYRIIVRIARHDPGLIEFAPHVISFRAPRERGGFPDESPRHDQFTMNILAYEKKLRSVIQSGPPA